jgi:hypothetical protein
MRHSRIGLLGVALICVLAALTFGNVLYGLIEGELPMPAGRGHGVRAVSRLTQPNMYWTLMVVLPAIAMWLGRTAHREIRKLRDAGRR